MAEIREPVPGAQYSIGQYRAGSTLRSFVLKCAVCCGTQLSVVCLCCGGQPDLNDRDRGDLLDHHHADCGQNP